MDIERLIHRIAKDEGFSPVSYWDRDHFSYGFGTPAPGPSAVIAYKEAWSILEERTAQAVREYQDIFRHVLGEINDVRGEALCNMLYNLGRTRFVKFRRMIRAIDRGDWLQAAYEAQESDWYKQVGKRAERIVKEIATGKREE